MKNLYVASILLLVLSCLTMGQRNEKSAYSVIWSENTNCHPANTDEVKALKPQCSKVQVDTVIFYIVTVDGVSYAMSHRQVRDFLVASVQISNKANSLLEVVTKRSRLGRFRSVEDYAASAKAEFSAAQSHDALQQASYREGEIGEREGGIRSGLKVRDRFEVDYNRGRIIRRPGSTINEPEAPPTENPMPSRITSELRIPKAVFDHLLKSKTLASGEKAAGHLVFKHPPDDSSYAVLYLNAGQFEFVFPVVGK